MKNSSLIAALPAVSIKVRNAVPTMARVNDVREPEGDAFENQGIDGTSEARTIA
jgi:hypothetical protein